MDTIPPTHRLIPFPPSTQAARHHSHTTEATNAYHQLLSALRRYNIAASKLTLTGRASTMRQLTQAHISITLEGLATIVHHESPTWAATISPNLPKAGNTAKQLGNGLYARPINPSSRQELRQYAIRKGVSPREAWARFPPTNSAEQAEYLRVTAPKTRAPTDPFESAVRAAARKEKRALDKAFREEFSTRLADLSSILGDLL